MAGPIVSPLDGHVFYLLETASWTESQTEAQSLGGNLATIDSQAENDWVFSTFADAEGTGRNLWIGLQDSEAEGTFEWVDGSPLAFTKWSTGEPNNNSIAGSSQDFVHLWGRKKDTAFSPSLRAPGTWNDHTDAGVDGSTSGNHGVVELIPEPSSPVLNLESYYESNPDEVVVVDATPMVGFPVDFDYQWYLDDFEIPPAFGGTASSYPIDGVPSSEGTWRVVVTNSAGMAEASFEYRVFADDDGDGLSNGREEVVWMTNPSLPDSDGDKLDDGAEVNVYGTNPSLADSDQDGFDDNFELNTGFDPVSGDSTPDALSSIRTAVEFRFNAADGVSYRIETTTDPHDSASWEIVEAEIFGEGSAITRFYSTENQPKRFFRVRRN